MGCHSVRFTHACRVIEIIMRDCSSAKVVLTCLFNGNEGKIGQSICSGECSAEVCGSTNFKSADNPRPQASGPQTVRGRSVDGPRPQL